ncbi:MAG: ATP-binding protein [Corynebacterium sp.]|uniref:AAA family ATPase n=1 Tax=Corynebacterium sp. TaxID=1720 RepID=UPI0026DCDB2F|nr:ATP-binding protein [Corynebacterium sp.]MDO4762577.1 ATP-binding protein [Corynebacterium sp.]
MDFYSQWKNIVPPDSGWAGKCHPVTMLMGANAAGKSNFLDALRFFSAAIEFSATTWLANRPQPHFPFELNVADKNSEPSMYELEFVFENTRYIYGFSWSYRGVHREWLDRVPGQRWAHCFVRDLEKGISWNNSFMPKSLVNELGKIGKTELILSVALRNQHKILAPIAQAITSKIFHIPVGERSLRQRMNQITRMIRDGALVLEDLSALMVAADTGIIQVKLNQRRIPPELLKQLKATIANLEGKKGNKVEDDASDEVAKLTDEELSDLVSSFSFVHQGEGVKKEFSIKYESTGTLAWLATAPLVLQVLREGGVILADELDASLHQTLVELLIQAFTDESINVHGAQLVFSSHNTNFLEHAEDLGVRAHGFWFIDKNACGASEVFSLADFSLQKNANYERRYLSGRYGALPHVSLSTLRGLVHEVLPDDELVKGNNCG